MEILFDLITQLSCEFLGDSLLLGAEHEFELVFLLKKCFNDLFVEVRLELVFFFVEVTGQLLPLFEVARLDRVELVLKPTMLLLKLL